MPFALADNQLQAVMKACEPLDPAKRTVLMERIAVQLRLAGVRYPSDRDGGRGIKAAMAGLLQGSAV